MRDYLRGEDDEGFDVGLVMMLTGWTGTDGRLARAFKRAGWKVIGVEEEG